MTRLLANVTCVAIAGRGLLFEGPPGSGKSTLAMALIDRGAILVGDDGIGLERRGDHLWALPPPNIAGRLEVRGVGIVIVPAEPAPLALALALGGGCDRLPLLRSWEQEGAAIPLLDFDATTGAAPLRAEWALRLHGVDF